MVIKLRIPAGLDEKLLGFSSSVPSSPKILTKPPKGRRLMEYRVSPLFILKIRGGKPKPNSSTVKPLLFAVIKWPHSWAKIKIPKTKMKIIKAVIPVYQLDPRKISEPGCFLKIINNDVS